jgi:serpin B
LNNITGTELNTANGLWVQLDYPILDEYHNRLTGFYGAEARQINLAGEPEESRFIINDWVENQTKGKIVDLFPEDSFNELTRLVLTNAVYFKGEWRYKFEPHETKQRSFYLTPNNTIQVDTMHLDEKKFNYIKNDEAQIIELPYANSSLSMIVILPCNRTLTELESEITMEKIETWVNSMHKQLMEIYLPKYSYESKSTMNQILSDMGMPTAFDPYAANLTGINPDGDLFVSKVVHQAFIEVNEEGAEAAAATGVVIELQCAIICEQFKADHPFMYLIMDKDTGSILFMGRVVDPSK